MGWNNHSDNGNELGNLPPEAFSSWCVDGPFGPTTGCKRLSVRTQYAMICPTSKIAILFVWANYAARETIIAERDVWRSTIRSCGFTYRRCVGNRPFIGQPACSRGSISYLPDRHRCSCLVCRHRAGHSCACSCNLSFQLLLHRAFLQFL
jgi:hypothetical protein